MADDVGALGRCVARCLLQVEARSTVSGQACATHPKPSELAAQMGVEVSQVQSPPPAQPRLRSEYAADPGIAGFSLPRTARPRITLYTDPISALGTALQAKARSTGSGQACATLSDLTELHIAHELFHHIESAGYGGLQPACTECLRSLIRDEVETAAHAFAEELMGLDFDPEEFPEL